MKTLRITYTLLDSNFISVSPEASRT